MGRVFELSQSFAPEQAAKLLSVTVERVGELALKVGAAHPASLTFKDLALMRAANSGTAPREIERIRARFDEDGQGLFDFDLGEFAEEASRLEPVRLSNATAEQFFAEGCELEDSDPEAARQAYERAVAADPRHADAHLNLGCLFHRHGLLRNAEHHYKLALSARADDATAAFNLAVVFEDQGRGDDAIAQYLRAIQLDSNCSDAYFNLARLYEKKGEKAAALRHLKDYKRLQER